MVGKRSYDRRIASKVLCFFPLVLLVLTDDFTKLRFGHYVGFRVYRHRIGGVPDPVCPQ